MAQLHILDLSESGRSMKAIVITRARRRSLETRPQSNQGLPTPGRSEGYGISARKGERALS